MKDSEQPQINEPAEPDQTAEPALEAPMMDMDVFNQMRDVVRNHYLWKWDESAVETREAQMELPQLIELDPRFRLVGDVELVNDVFEVTLWLQDSAAFSVGAVDMMVLDVLSIDLGKGTVIARELTKLGIEYHLITFGEGRARQYLINVIGPRMQQIRDLGRLVVQTLDTYSA